MKCIKCLTCVYVAIVLTVLTGILVACSTIVSESKQYTFNTAYHDEIPGMSADSLDILFEHGITAKYFEDKIYYIYNPGYHESYNFPDGINWGPVTLLMKEGQTHNNFYDLNIKHIDQEYSDVTLHISLTNLFNLPLTKITFKPSWVSYVEDGGFTSVINLPEVIIMFPNARNYGENIDLPITWKAKTSELRGNPLLVSTKAICEYKGGSGPGIFIETMTFYVDNYLK